MRPLSPPPGSGVPVLRFAPSPNGFLHLGHAYSALMNQRVAERCGGILRLRFEDIDPARCRPGYAAAAVADLDWLGIAITPPVLYQADRFDAYKAALDRFRDAGLVYPCFCTRGDIARAVAEDPHWPRDPDGSPVYPGRCRHLAPAERAGRLADGQAAALRLDMAAALRRIPPDLAWEEWGEGAAGRAVAAQPAAWGDVLLARKDVPTSYHLSVVVDDAAQGVSEIVRGEDLFAATAVHRLLQVLLGLPAPRYHHHRLVTGADGAKLAKSRGAPALRDLRRAGTTPEEILDRLGFRGGGKGAPAVEIAARKL